MTLWKRFLAATFLTLVTTTATLGDSPAEMLEKGIYNEDTIGNLDEAIKIYRQVLTAAGETQAVAAKAQYRLGQCLLKQGKKTEATDAFKAIVSDYPNQKDLVQKAKQHLSDEPALQKAPWKDGERLTLEMALPGGRVIGIVGLGVNTNQLNQADIWEMTIRRFVAGGQNEGVSKVWVDRQSNQPLRTLFDHTIFGKTDAKWGNDKMTLKRKTPGKDEVASDVELTQPAYSNDQVFYALRQLPLKVGYEVTLPLRVAFTGGNAIGLEVTVEKKEKVETPAGSFDCFRLETNINQTFWIADVPERYLAKFEAEGVTAKLTSISHDDKPREYNNEKLGFSCTVPKGWFVIEPPTENENSSAVLQFIAPQMATATLVVKDKVLLDADERNSLEKWMASKLRRSKASFQDFKVTREDVKQVEFGNLQGLSFSGYPMMGKRKYLFGNTIGHSETKCAQLIIQALKSEAAAAEKDFDALQASFKLR